MGFYGERIDVLGLGSYGKVHLVKIMSLDLSFSHLIVEKSCEEEVADSLVKEKEILDQFN
ncbi:MAP kinase kinase kinase mkh1-like isoform 2 [Corchorus olitorius]|uniref:MAP kinase kinase kinase mkh1-like isoform 2 n=1 Tax=Corchorus olitorius TaxID=93759 RepID=A0A1R3GND4_9ROSI|nr:MAP kinase kinase kinase mkh1-like isoform 2 [Corchorus olitorius]